MFSGMASPATKSSNFYAQARGDSDYGSDFSAEEEEIVNRLLAEQERVEVIEDNPVVTDFEYHDQAQTVRVPWVIGRGRVSDALLEESGITKDTRLSSAAIQPEYPDLSHVLPQFNTVTTGPETNTMGDEKPDTRSPIERFRTAPKKPLSVTDLVSPAWCELQYWYALKIRGKPKQTKAMQEGSAVHKELEEKIYTTVRVEIATKEDGWGLRIWNVIQGLRTLQEIGYTRELEVWGTVDGLVVNGIIDEVSFTCPDPELEAQFENREPSGKNELPADQTTISDFFKASRNTSIVDATGSEKRAVAKKIYICDVKTRLNRKLPIGAAFRPTKMQLMIYHYLLTNLVTNQVDFEVLLNRHELDGDKPFSDSFIAKMGSLNEGIPFDPLLSTMHDSSGLSSQDSVTILLQHNSLRQLWSFMIKTYQSLLPAGRDSIGTVLRAEYRSRDNGEVLGSSTLSMDYSALKVYLDHELKWWKGEREPLGVIIEEAYKCKTCDYAEICDWRRARVAEATEKARANKKAIREVKKWEV